MPRAVHDNGVDHENQQDMHKMREHGSHVRLALNYQYICLPAYPSYRPQGSLADHIPELEARVVAVEVER